MRDVDSWLLRVAETTPGSDKPTYNRNGTHNHAVHLNQDAPPPPFFNQRLPDGRHKSTDALWRELACGSQHPTSISLAGSVRPRLLWR